MDAVQLTFTIETAFAHVACPSRLGEIKRRGPVTGKEWLISPRGCWIDADDAAELVQIIEDVWCFRIEGWLKMHTVYYLDPTREQLALRPD